MADMRVERVAGVDLAPWLDDVARLRVAVFRDWPYLYAGDLAYEREYLRAYARSPGSVVVLALDGGRVVGASTGLPLADDTAADAAMSAYAPYQRALLTREQRQRLNFTIDGDRPQLATMIEADEFGLGDWKLVESSEQAMLVQVGRAVKRDQFVVFLGWTPHPMNVQFDMQYLKGGEKFFGSTGSVNTLARKGFVAECPNVGALLKNLKFDLAMEGEGETWDQSLRLILKDNGERLHVTEPSSSSDTDDFPRKWCPA